MWTRVALRKQKNHLGHLTPRMATRPVRRSPRTPKRSPRFNRHPPTSLGPQRRGCRRAHFGPSPPGIAKGPLYGASAGALRHRSYGIALGGRCRHRIHAGRSHHFITPSAYGQTRRTSRQISSFTTSWASRQIIFSIIITHRFLTNTVCSRRTISRNSITMKPTSSKPHASYSDLCILMV